MGITRKLIFVLGAVFSVLSFQSVAADKFHGAVCAEDEDSAECDTAKAWMRRNHPDFLKHNRYKTMREGIRARDAEGDPTRFSLRGCVSCHVKKDEKTGEYPKITSKKHHCAGCHIETATTLDCFECHSSKPDAETIKRLGIGKKDGHDHSTHSHGDDDATVDFKAMAAKTTAAVTALFSGANANTDTQSATLQGILFETGSANLVAGSKGVLNQVAQALKATSGNIEIAGFTDNTGNDATNSKISQERAQTVSQYLVAQGVSVARITTKGYGSANPVADNSTAQGRKQNRRVELKKL